MTLDDFCAPSVSTKVLIRRKQMSQSHRKKMEVGIREKRDAVLQAWKTEKEEAGAKEWRHPVEAGKGKVKHSPLELLKGKNLGAGQE